MSFFPYEPPVSDDEPEDDDLWAALQNDQELAALQSHRSDGAVVMPAADAIEQPMAVFLDALLAANVGASKEQVQQQFMVLCRRQFEAAATRQNIAGDLGKAEEQHVARLLSWLD